MTQMLGLPGTCARQPRLITISRDMHTRLNPCRCATASRSVPHLLDWYNCTKLISFYSSSSITSILFYFLISYYIYIYAHTHNSHSPLVFVQGNVDQHQLHLKHHSTHFSAIPATGRQCAVLGG